MKTPTTLINTCLVLGVATMASLPGMSTGVEARPMHAGIDYERYLLEKEDIVNELKSWMSKWKEAAKRNGWLPVTEARSTDDVEEDQKQRFFMAKQLVSRLKKENPSAEFSTDSPFSLMTTEEFSRYIKNSYIAGGGRALREEVAEVPAVDSNVVVRSNDFSASLSDYFKRLTGSDNASVKASTGSNYNINIRDWFNTFDWSSLFRPTTAPPTRPPVVAPTVTPVPRPTAPAPVPTTTVPAPVPTTTVPAPATTTPAPVPTTTRPVPMPTTTRPVPVPTTTRPSATPNPNLPVAPIYSPTNAPVPTPSPSGEVSADGNSLDWSAGKCMPPIQNQGQCGSCWSFASVAIVEAGECIAKKSATFTKYSEQMLASCDTSRNQGCNGGVPQYALQYIQNNGLCTLANDPYKSSNGVLAVCNTGCTKVQTGMTAVKPLAQNEPALMSALNQHPVVIAMQAGNDAWKQYKSGVLSACPSASPQVDHAVVAVGYDATTIKVRNSWGTGWGEAGYIHLARSTSGLGTCKMFQQMVHATF